MAFKLKAGKEGPMRKNFPAAFKQKDGKIDLSKKSDKELANIARRNIDAAKNKADKSVYLRDGETPDGPEKNKVYAEFAQNRDYGGLASDSISAARTEIEKRINKKKNPAQMKESPMYKDKGTYKTTTNKDGGKSKVYVSKNKKKSFVSSEAGNVIEKKKDNIFNPNKTKSKKVNLNTGETTITKTNTKTGNTTVRTRKTNKGDSRVVKKGRKKTTPPKGTKIV